MWKCTNCNHIELVSEKPEKCSVCGVDAEKLVTHELPGIKGEKTPQNIKATFVAESQAHLRNLAFAMKAEQDDYRQIAKLFRAVAEAEAVHAFNYLRLFGGVVDTQTNLQNAFERENLASSTYPRFIKEANVEDNNQVATILGYSRDVERGHSKLYENALQHMLGDVDSEYYVCGICGYVSDGILPDNCPICGAPKERFRKVV